MVCLLLEVLKNIIKASTNLFTRQELCYWMIAHTSIDFIPTVVPKVPIQLPYIFQKKESYVYFHILLFLLLKFQKNRPFQKNSVVDLRTRRIKTRFIDKRESFKHRHPNQHQTLHL